MTRFESAQSRRVASGHGPGLKSFAPAGSPCEDPAVRWAFPGAGTALAHRGPVRGRIAHNPIAHLST